MSDPLASGADQGAVLLALYDEALPEVYGYLVSRCGNPSVAEDLTSETFLAAVKAIQRGTVPMLTIAWLVSVARRRLVDHWRATSREERKIALVESDEVDDEWDARLDAVRSRAVLGQLSADHRAALTLRYLDGLPVPEVAHCLGRSVHATEGLLVRARAGFRRAYGERGTDAG